MESHDVPVTAKELARVNGRSVCTLGGPGTDTNAVVMFTDCDWAGPPPTLEELAGFLLKDATGTPVWPAGIPFPEEAEDEGLLIGEPVWTFRPDDNESETSDDENLPPLVERVLVDSSDDNSDMPPPLLTRHLLVESSSSESESEKWVIAGQLGSPPDQS
jgi:hypothetical protein